MMIDEKPEFLGKSGSRVSTVFFLDLEGDLPYVLSLKIATQS